MNNDLISREALKKALKSNCKPELCHDYNTAWCEHCCPHNDFEDLIDNAPTVDLKDIYQEGHYDGHIEGYTKAINEERPQSDIRWTDKVFVKSNGDIIDFEGRVVGHINLEDMKGGAE